MGYDLGSIVPLRGEVRDAAGALANATSVVVHVTLPDGTAAAGSPFTPTNPSTGIYQYDYTTVQAGRHQRRWVASGTNADTWGPDPFDVWPVNSRFAISVDEARSALNLATGNDANDEEIRLFIASATHIIEDVTGPIFGTDTFTEQHHPTTARLILDHAHPVTFGSVVSYSNGSPTTLTKANTPDAATNDQFTVDPATHTITRRAAGGPEQQWGDEVWVTYTAGMTTVPFNLILAARELVQYSFGLSQQAARPSFEGTGVTPGELVPTPSGYLIPYRVMAWLKPHEQLRVGFA